MFAFLENDLSAVSAAADYDRFATRVAIAIESIQDWVRDKLEREDFLILQRALSAERQVWLGKGLQRVGAEDVGTGPPLPEKAIKESLSKRDERVYRHVGIRTFESLTNDEIFKRFRAYLRRDEKLESQNAVRACLNRIRRFYNLPRSNALTRNPVK
jgi:hypothetical protein